MFITYYRIDQRRDFGFPIAGELFGVFYDKRGWLSIRVRASPIPLQACTTFGLLLVALMKSTILNVFEKQGLAHTLTLRNRQTSHLSTRVIGTGEWKFQDVRNA